MPTPLSPLLFSLVIEALAMAIWAAPDIKAIQISRRQYKMLLYADDIVFLLHGPVTSIKVLGNLLDLFAQASGYKVSTSKSIIMGVNTTFEIKKEITAS